MTTPTGQTGTACARNLPQHFNGCTCAPGATTAEAPEVDLAGPDQNVYGAIVAEGEAWEMVQYAEMNRRLAQEDLTAEENKPRWRRSSKRIAARTAEVDQANADVTEKRKAQVDAYHRITDIPALDEVEALEREVSIAHRHAAVMGRIIGLTVFDRDHDKTTRKQRKRIQRSLDFYDREHRNVQAILRATRSAHERAAAERDGHDVA